MTQNDRNSKDFDVLAYMRSLSPSKDEKFICKTVSDWTTCWLLHYCGSIKDSTRLEYSKLIDQHINRLLGRVELTELTHEDVQLFINSLKLGIGIPEELSPKSIKNIHGVLHKCLCAAVDYGYIPVNPAEKIVLPQKTQTEVQHLEPRMLHDFFAAIQNHPKRLVFMTSIFTGMREGEIIALTWDSVRFDTGDIHLYRQLSNKNPDKIYRFTSLKNGKTRTIHPAPFMMDLLKKHFDASKNAQSTVLQLKRSAQNLIAQQKQQTKNPLH